MDGIIGLAHFCETHGPCIILSTQRCHEEPQQFPHNLTVPWCESCQSINLDQSLVSKNENASYVTTRTPLQQNLAFLLKQAAVRSLSCEETSKDGGTMYFGDNERGHVLSHTFSLQDSLARGFHRKYSILVLTTDKIHLLNSWPILTKNIKSISSNLQSKATKVNDVEQAHCFQRAVRQAQGSPVGPARSLSQLTGEVAIFAQLHMWFTWLLTIEPVKEKPNKVPEIPVQCSASSLRAIFRQMDEGVFRIVAYCILTGIKVEVENANLLEILKQILPKHWALPKAGQVCKLRLVEDRWAADWSGNLPPKLPKLLCLIEEALKNDNLPDAALEPYLVAAIFRWRNIAKTLSWVATPNSALFQALGVQKFDLPLLAYWTAQCRSESQI